MPILKVQLPHPGPQKPFKLGSGYINVGGHDIREWNNDFFPPNRKPHYRKFIKNQGVYLDNISDLNPKKENLFFWGEWEGHSFFSQIINPDYRILPNGVHEPFHSIKLRGHQNTDPYIFGDYFKYCICKQREGNMENLDPNSLIIFGSVFPSLGKFYIDTVFVVKDNETSVHVQHTRAVGYTQVYKEETLEQLNEYLKAPQITKNKKLYHSQTWWDNKDYFSFAPCKLNAEINGFERLFLNLDDKKFNLTTYPGGLSYMNNSVLSPYELWGEIAKIAEEQGFKLGIRFDEPAYSNALDQL
jgi:hypothetical protein